MSQDKQYIKECMLSSEVKDEWFAAAKSGNTKLLRDLALRHDQTILNISDEVTSISVSVAL